MLGAIDTLVAVVYGVLAVYLIGWLLLLIGCIRRKRFWPILGRSRATKWFWLATFVFLNPALTLLYVVFGRLVRPDARARPVASVAIIVVAVALIVGGAWVSFPGLTHLWAVPWVGKAGDSEPILKAHVARIEAEENTSSSCSLVSNANSRFASRRIVIINESGDPLMKLIAKSLRSRLAELPAVEAVDLGLDGQFPPDGSRAPDVYVRLDLSSIRQTHVPYTRTLEANVSVSAGRQPWAGNHSRSDRYTLPRIVFDWNASLHHRSKTVGYESVKNTMAAESIAKSLAKQLGTSFKKWREKYGPPPELPDGFGGRYLLEHVHRESAGRSWGSQGGTRDANGRWSAEYAPPIHGDFVVRARVVQSARKGLFDVTVRTGPARRAKPKTAAPAA